MLKQLGPVLLSSHILSVISTNKPRQENQVSACAPKNHDQGRVGTGGRSMQAWHAMHFLYIFIRWRVQLIYVCNCSTAQPNIHNLCEILNILSIQRAIKDCRRGGEQKVTKFSIQMSSRETNIKTKVARGFQFRTSLDRKRVFQKITWKSSINSSYTEKKWSGASLILATFPRSCWMAIDKWQLATTWITKV